MAPARFLLENLALAAFRNCESGTAVVISSAVAGDRLREPSKSDRTAHTEGVVSQQTTPAGTASYCHSLYLYYKKLTVCEANILILRTWMTNWRG